MTEAGSPRITSTSPINRSSSAPTATSFVRTASRSDSPPSSKRRPRPTTNASRTIGRTFPPSGASAKLVERGESARPVLDEDGVEHRLDRGFEGERKIVLDLNHVEQRSDDAFDSGKALDSGPCPRLVEGELEDFYAPAQGVAAILGCSMCCLELAQIGHRQSLSPLCVNERGVGALDRGRLFSLDARRRQQPAPQARHGGGRARRDARRSDRLLFFGQRPRLPERRVALLLRQVLQGQMRSPRFPTRSFEYGTRPG